MFHSNRKFNITYYHLHLFLHSAVYLMKTALFSTQSESFQGIILKVMEINGSIALLHLIHPTWQISSRQIKLNLQGPFHSQVARTWIRSKTICNSTPGHKFCYGAFHLLCYKILDSKLDILILELGWNTMLIIESCGCEGGEKWRVRWWMAQVFLLATSLGVVDVKSANL